MARQTDVQSTLRPLTPIKRTARHANAWCKCSLILSALLLCLLVLPMGAEAASRSLTLHNTHTKETTTITYKRNGRFDADGLRQLNRFLRDWRRNESTKMDPALFDLIWEVYKATGAKKPIYVVSGYRSPATNNMLRRRSSGVAKNSRHTMGQAMDFYLPGVPIKKIRDVGLRLQAGGVGYYPTSGSPFVHIDTGNVRHWPRMTRKQLAAVFPDGKTVHVPSDGKPFSGYKQAKAQVARTKAEMARSSRSVGRFTQVARAAPQPEAPTASSAASGSAQPSLISRLFGGAEENAASGAVSAPAMPMTLAALPRSPADRPSTAIAPIAPIDLALDGDDGTAEQAEDFADVEQRKEELVVEMASLPRTRPDTAPAMTPNAAINLADDTAASAQPGGNNQTIDMVAVNEQGLPQGAPETSSTPDATEGLFQLAALPRARDRSLPSPTEQTAPTEPAPINLAEQETPSFESTGSTGQTTPAVVVASANDGATASEDSVAPEGSATDVLARMTGAETAQGDTDTSRIAYASASENFLAALPSSSPRGHTTEPASPANAVGALPQSAERTQLASLNTDVTPPAPAAASQSSTGARSYDDPLSRLTFAYGQAGMSHFAHIKQSTRTATFARLSRPMPGRLSALVAKPGSIIDQSFSHETLGLTQDRQFSGPAIARMAIRSFN